jgi:hypothetical protein
MGVGHVALALGAAKVTPRLNAGWLVFAALLADFLLGIFAWMGLESAHVPENYAAKHYLTFTFPYSHGLAPLILWGAILGFLVSRAAASRSDRTIVFAVVAAVVVSHFLLDGLVHVAGLPLAGENSPKLGLGLWKNMPLELTLETLMSVAGVWIYLTLAGIRASAVSRYGVTIFMVVLTALTWTQLFSTRAPNTAQLIPNWIVAPVLLAAIVYVLDRKRAAAAATVSA